MKRIRVLIVDDAVVVRRMVSDVLAADPGIEVVGTAANGRIALQKITQVNPDILTLDVEMPEMDGLQTLKALRETYRDLPVIMFSTLTERGGTATLTALSLGATDYVTKPANVGSVALAQQRIKDELIPKIKALCGRSEPVALPPRPPTPPAPLRAAAATGSTTPEIVCIGVSTGGPNALAKLMPRLPANLPVPIVVVQHMPPMFTRLLGERLNTQSAIAVAEATDGQVLLPGHAYIAPGDFHLVVQRKNGAVVTALNQAPQENSCRPAVDPLFRSVSEVYGARALGIVMTGMGQDGLRGCEDLTRVGARVVVQDEASSVVWGMPGFVARAGLADRVLPLDEIAGEIIRRCARPAAVAAGIR
jgi:two-component system, chemotaxis family, protein-glutamate methylesterase/glutaminase